MMDEEMKRLHSSFLLYSIVGLFWLYSRSLLTLSRSLLTLSRSLLALSRSLLTLSRSLHSSFLLFIVNILGH